MPREPANEHVFYDPATAKAVAAQIADRLAAIDAATPTPTAPTPRSSASKADEILASERAIGQDHPGASVVATEPVAHYLLVNAGITDKTPEGFANAIEEDTDPSPADLAAMLDLISTRQVSALLYNPQTETAVTKQLQDAADARVGSRRHRDRDPARGHRLPDLAAPDRRAAGEPVG